MSDSDSWETPCWLFDELNQEFNFDIDLCATKENSKCAMFYHDYLNDISATVNHIFEKEVFSRHAERLGIKTAFMNPPYSNPKLFIEKAWEDSKHCKIVCLVKVDPSTKWWSTFWDYSVRCPWCRGEGLYSTDNPEFFDNDHYVNCTHCTYHKSIKSKYNGPKPGCEVRFFPKRIKFDAPRDFKGKTSGPSFASCLIIMDRRGIKL